MTHKWISEYEGLQLKSVFTMKREVAELKNDRKNSN